MLQRHDPLEALTSAELEFGRGLCVWSRRVAGLSTLCVLGMWITGASRALDEVGKAVIIAQISAYMELNQPVDVPLDVDLDVRTPEDAQDLLQSRVEARRAAREQRIALARQMQTDIVIHGKVQGAATAAWTVVMVLTGVVLLCAGVAGLSGSPRRRRWHGAAAKWILFSTACSGLGIYVLSRWGGFPLPDDYVFVAERLAWQLSYAVLIAVLMVVTRRAPNHAAIESRLQVPPPPLPASEPGVD